jgi:hypothetical protein
LQWLPFPYLEPLDYWLAQYNVPPTKLVLEDEVNYEDLIPPYTDGAIIPKWKTCQRAWQSQIGGAFSFTYGEQGIW